MINEDKIAAFTAIVNSAEFSHARARSWRASGYIADKSDLSVYAYVQDVKSPSGVHLGAVLGDFDLAVSILDKAGRPFPISPTERR